MDKIEKYLRYAADCREMARTSSPAHRQQLEQMAKTWEQLAKSREQQPQRLNHTTGGLTIEFETPPGQPSKRDGSKS